MTYGEQCLQSCKCLQSKDLRYVCGKLKYPQIVQSLSTLSFWSGSTDFNFNTYDENPCSTVTRTSSAKELPLTDVSGNASTIGNHRRAKQSRTQAAYIQGRRGLSPTLHFAVSHPPKIWHGKSIKTAKAKSSLPSPFSTSLRVVTASFAWKPTLQKKWTMMSDRTSASIHLVNT